MASAGALVFVLVLVLVVANGAVCRAHFFQIRFNLSRHGHGHGHWHGHGHRYSLSREFLEAHNRVRRELNEVPLVWDRNLARYARRWAARRVWDCQMIHSYGPYGENAFWGGQDHWTAREAVESWVMERVYYNPETNQCVKGQMCGHYTQVVWRNTRRVGCTRMRCLNGGLLVFCEYDPPGNFLNENPFGKLFYPLSSLVPDLLG